MILFGVGKFEAGERIEASLLCNGERGYGGGRGWGRIRGGFCERRADKRDGNSEN